MYELYLAGAIAQNEHRKLNKHRKLNIYLYNGYLSYLTLSIFHN